MRIAVIGAGMAGVAAAHTLAAAGHDVTVFNRTIGTAERWVRQYGGRTAATPADAARDAAIVFACVGRDADLAEVTRGSQGAFQAMRAGGLFVDHTTASAGIARALAEAAREGGFGFVDAPVSGGEQGAKNGQLTIMCGGSTADYDKAAPVMRSRTDCIAVCTWQPLSV